MALKNDQPCIPRKGVVSMHTTKEYEEEVGND